MGAFRLAPLPTTIEGVRSDVDEQEDTCDGPLQLRGGGYLNALKG
jgi:hypothetical protein